MSEAEQSKGSIGQQVFTHLLLPLLPVISTWILGVFSTPLGLKYLLTIFMAFTVLVYPLLIVSFIEKRGPKLHVALKVALYAATLLVLMGIFSLFPSTIRDTFNAHADEVEFSKGLASRFSGTDIYQRPPANSVTRSGPFLVRAEEGNIQILIPYRWSKKEIWGILDRNYTGQVLLEGPGSLRESSLNFETFRLRDYDVRPSNGVLSFFLAWAEGPILFKDDGKKFLDHLTIPQ